MQIVINIPEELYTEYVAVQLGRGNGKDIVSKLLKAIKNGTPLPKGHGNLIDYDDLIEKLDRYGRKEVKYQLPYSPTIIFADKEDDNE